MTAISESFYSSAPVSGCAHPGDKHYMHYYCIALNSACAYAKLRHHHVPQNVQPLNLKASVPNGAWASCLLDAQQVIYELSFGVV